MVRKALSKTKKAKPEWDEIFRSELKLIYLYQRQLSQPVDMQTPTARLEWFSWCLNNDVDPEIKIKKNG